jgi:hypothetical protein
MVLRDQRVLLDLRAQPVLKEKMADMPEKAIQVQPVRWVIQAQPVLKEWMADMPEKAIRAQPVLQDSAQILA